MIQSIGFKLYKNEFNALNRFLRRKHQDVLILKGQCAVTDIALSEWFSGAFMRKMVSIASNNNNTTFKISIPTSVCIMLWQQFQHETIPQELQMVLAELDRQLTDSNFKPL